MKYLCLSILASILASSCSHQAPITTPMRSPASMRVLNTPAQSATSNYKREAMRLANQFRRQHGLPALRRNARLEKAAQEHSAVMAKHGYLGHHQPGRSSRPMKRALKVGYQPSIIAENLFGPNMRMSAIDHAHLTPQHAVNGWITSAGHRRNLLDPRVREVGYGYVDGFWTQLLGATDKYNSPRKEPAKAKATPKRIGPVRKPAPAPFNYRNL